jgi:hypothetical protein
MTPYQAMVQQANQAFQDMGRERSLYYAQQQAQNAPYQPGSDFERQYEQLLVNPQPIKEASILAGFGPTKGRSGSKISSKKVADTQRKAVSQYQFERSREAVRGAQSRAGASVSRSLAEHARRQEIFRALRAAEAEERRMREDAEKARYANASPEERARMDRERATREMSERIRIASLPISRHLGGAGGLSIY